MSSIQACAIPQASLLHSASLAGAYADCYVTDVAGVVSHAEFVEAFYTTEVFKLERLILKTLVSKPSTDIEARQLARGERDSFAAWRVEGRDIDQLLLADFSGRTKSWLMVAADNSGGRLGTRLYFGSAVVPVRDSLSRKASLGFVFQALLGFHKLYSRVLLRAARSRLERRRRKLP